MQDQATMGDLVQKQVANDAPSLAIARTHDQNLQGTDTKAILASGLTLADAMANPLYRDALLKHTLLRDGSVDVDGVPTATYSIIDPHVKVSMDAPSVAIAAQIFPSWQTAFDNAGGSLQMKLGQIKAVTDQVNSVEYAEKIFGDAANSKDPLLQKLGISSDVEGKIMSAVRQGTPGAQQARQTLMALENSKAAGGTLADTLNRLINDPDARPGSAYILNALGITANQAQDYIDSVQNERVRQATLAKEGGMGEKAPAAQTQVNALVQSIQSNPDMSEADKKGVMVDVPAADKDGVVRMTQGQVEKTVARMDAVITTNKNNAEKKALANGDPAQLKQTASNIIEGDVNQITKVASMRGNARENLVNALHDEAADRGLDTTQYTQAALDNKAATQQDYSGNKKGSTGAQIASFNTLVGHIQEAANLTKKLEGKTIGLTNSPWMNTASDTIAKQFANDPDWAAYKASLAPVQNEYANLLAAGYSPKEEDAATIRQIMDPHETPARVMAALKQLATTADVRLANMAQRYIDTMGTTKPNMLSVDSRNTFKNLGIPSKTEPLTVALPRGWQGGQAQKLTNPDIAKLFVQAAGGDNTRAAELAKSNGWSL
jgi:hypothetical protein